jgi:hypothetical protein
MVMWMWCCSWHSVQVLLNSTSETLLFKPSCVLWQLQIVVVCLCSLQLVLPTMVVIVTTVLIWLVLVSTAVHTTVIHCSGLYIAVSCWTWHSCSVTCPIQNFRELQFFILEVYCMGHWYIFFRIALSGTIHLEQPGICFFVTVFSLHKAYFILWWYIELGKVFAHAPGFFRWVLSWKMSVCVRGLRSLIYLVLHVLNTLRTGIFFSIFITNH